MCESILNINGKDMTIEKGSTIYVKEMDIYAQKDIFAPQKIKDTNEEFVLIPLHLVQFFDLET